MVRERPIGVLHARGSRQTQDDVLGSIMDYQAAIHGKDDREYSWEHCYRQFHQARENVGQRDLCALNLGFYLASFGMFRGSGFLLQHTHTVQNGIVDLVYEPHFSELWSEDVGTSIHHRSLVPLIMTMVSGIREVYEPFAQATGSKGASDTLVTKVILGTMGCLPACDLFFLRGWRREGLSEPTPFPWTPETW